MIADDETLLEGLSIEDDGEQEKQAATDRPETVEESAARVVEELNAAKNNTESDKDVSGGEGEETEASKVSEAARTLAKNRKQKRKIVEGKELEQAPEAPKQQLQKLDPPEQWSVEDKEYFNKQDPVWQRNALKWFTEARSNATKLAQELYQRRKPYEEIEKVAERYVKDWGRSGLTPTQGIIQALSFYNDLLTNRSQALAHLQEITGMSPEQFFNTQAPQQQAGPPAVPAHLTEQGLRSMIETVLGQSSQQQAVYQAQAEVDQVRRQVDPMTGKYLYPELHDPAHTRGLETLVEDLRRTEPGISWAEATKRAIHVRRMLQGQQSQSGPLPNSEQLDRARAAAVSVKSRGNSSTPTLNIAKAGESVAESARIVAAMFNNSN